MEARGSVAYLEADAGAGVEAGTGLGLGMGAGAGVGVGVADAEDAPLGAVGGSSPMVAMNMVIVLGESK